jgi:threonine dehydratase
MSRSSDLKVSMTDIEEAHAFLADYLTPTPLVMNAWLSELFGAEIYLKLENMQPIGAFKLRGATYKISKLTDAERKKE